MDMVEEVCRRLADGDTWGAMEHMRRWYQDKGQNDTALTVAEYQSKVKKPWE